MKAIIMLALLLSACAAPDERLLTKEQDAHLREQCAKTDCVIIPVPVWEQIRRVLKEKGV